MFSTAPLILAAIAMALLANLWRGLGHQPDPGLLARAGKRFRKDAPARGDKPKAARRMAVLSYLIGLGAVAGVIPFQDAIAGWTASRSGLGVLAVADMLLAGAVWWEVRHLHGFHRVWTMIACFAGGVVTVDSYASWNRMLRQGTQLLPQTFAAIRKASHRTGNGRAARAAHRAFAAVHVPGAKGFPTGTVVGVLAIVLIMFVAVGGHRAVSGANRRMRAASARRDARGYGGGGGAPVGGAPSRRALG